MGKKTLDIGLGSDFMDKTLKAKATKVKKWEILKLKKFKKIKKKTQLNILLCSKGNNQ